MLIKKAIFKKHQQKKKNFKVINKKSLNKFILNIKHLKKRKFINIKNRIRLKKE